MKTQYLKLTDNRIPKKPIGESWLMELDSPFNPDVPSSKYLIHCHKCGHNATLQHDVKIENNLITISPSLVCPQKDCPAHYFIENSEVRDI